MNPSDSVSPVTAIRLVAARELNTRLRTKSFTIGTAAILVALAGFMVLQATLFSNATTSKIGLAGQSTSIAQPLQAQAEQLGLTIETSTVPGQQQARELVASGELDAVVSGSPAEPQVLVKSELDDQVRGLLTGIAQSQVLTAKLADAGMNPAEVLADVQQTRIAVTPIDAPDPERDQRMVIGLIIVVLMFISIMTYGSLVAQGVVEEKSSRVVEILLSTVRPWHLMLGKVVGLGLVGLVQLLIVAVAGLIMATATGVLTVSGVATGTLLWGVLWYVLGFFLYATVFAGAGSLVSRQEEVQSVVTPVTMVLVIGYVVGLNLLLQDPESTATTVLSMIPVLSPILMPGRIAIGVAAGWQVALALALTIGTIALFTWIGGTVYRNAVLRTGSRMKLAEALRG